MQLYYGNLGMCSYLFHQAMHSKLLRVFAVLEVYSRRLLLFLTSEARTEEKKISRLMMQCYLLFVYYIS